MKYEDFHPFVILTGGPGGGKTALIHALRQRGYECVDEVAREIIKREVVKNGDALPWGNQQKFFERMFEESVSAYRNQKHQEIVFFDRGIIDSLGYARLSGLEISEMMHHLAADLPFNKLVFVTPPWKDIYTADKERTQTFEEAIATYEHIVAIYQEYGYKTVDLPLVGVDQRVEFILEHLEVDSD